MTRPESGISGNTKDIRRRRQDCKFDLILGREFNRCDT